MRRLLPVLVATLLLVAACSDDGGSTQGGDETFAPPSSTSDGPGRPSDGPAPDIDDLPDGTVVFSPDDVESDAHGEETTWTPTVEDVDAVDRALQGYIDDHPDLGVDDLDEYVRQYVGTGEVGDVASVNALCDEETFDWQDEYVVVDDGGTCFWQAEVSFFTLDVDSFTVNGQA